MTQSSVTIIGAGIVGLVCAHKLQQQGFAVTIVDREGPCAGASFGNAAHIAIASIFPQSVPGIAGQSWRLLRDRHGPLIANPAYVLQRSPWFLKFLRLGNADAAARGTHVMSQLLSHAWEHWNPVLQDIGATHLMRQTGALHVFGSRQAMQNSQGAYFKRQQLGVECRVLGVEEAREMEPALTEHIAGAVHIPAMGHVTDTRQLCQALADRITANGGRLLRQQVTAIRNDGVQTTEAFLPSSQVVLAAGAWSSRFARELGVSVPVVSERGYHVQLPRSASALRTPVLLVENKVALTPMEDGLRMASVAEFTSPDAAPDHDRAAFVFQGLERWVSGADARPESRWVGPRPSTPDSRPIIGRSPAMPNVLLAYGHGHLGLSLGALTGSLIAALATGQAPPIDLSWLSPTRRLGKTGMPA